MLYNDSTLKRLARTFTASDIMVPKEKLTLASNKQEAQEKAEAHDFDIIPIVNTKGQMRRYFNSEYDKVERIRYCDVISDNTDILSLVNILQNRKFCFVLVINEIGGYIHFSDLNNRIVALPYFLILQDLEEHLVKKIRDIEPPITTMCKILGRDRFEEIDKKMREMKENRANLDWVNLLPFGDILPIAKHLEVVELQGDEFDILANVRNKVCHRTCPLLEKHKDVKLLARVRGICQKIRNNFGC